VSDPFLHSKVHWLLFINRTDIRSGYVDVALKSTSLEKGFIKKVADTFFYYPGLRLITSLGRLEGELHEMYNR
jgi:hypothetical protein